MLLVMTLSYIFETNVHLATILNQLLQDCLKVTVHKLFSKRAPQLCDVLLAKG